MNDSLRLVGKRALTVATVAATLLWTVGVSALVAPAKASAATMGSLIKGPTLSTVYYYAKDGSRYAFPNEKTYFTWYSDFSSVTKITDSELAAIPLAGNVVYRPGSRFLKIQSDPKTYAVEPNGKLRWIETEAVAMGLDGANWSQFIDDVPDVFFNDYTVGMSLTSASKGYNGMLVAGSTFLVWNGEERMVTDAGFSANRFQSRFVEPGPGVDHNALPNGADITGGVAGLMDPAQLPETISGGLNVSLASDTPPSATIPGDADSVSFTKVKLTASSGSAMVDSMIFKLGGVGVVANIAQAYLYEGSTRLSDGRNVNGQSREVTFGALGIDLTNGESTYVSVRVDVDAGANGGDTANFGLTSSSSVLGSATVSGNFPVVGNTMTFSDTDAGTLLIDKRGTITNPTLGEKGATIAKFSAEAQNEDASLREITVNVDDSADHSNYKLYEGASLLANGTVAGDLVSFVLTQPLAIDEGDQANLDVKADIGGDANNDLSVGVEEAADVMAIGGDFGFNMNIDILGYDAVGNAACNDGADDCSFSTVQGGDLTFAFNGPPSGDVQVDGNEQVLMKFTVTSQNWVELQGLSVTIACAVAADGCADNDNDDGGGLINDVDGADDPDDLNFEDIKIVRENGSTFMGPEELLATGSDLTQTLDFNDTQILQAGTSTSLMVVVDVANNADDTAGEGFIGNQFRATLEMGADVDAEDVNGDALVGGDIVPGADLGGNIFDVVEASLDVRASTPPSSSTYVKGAANVDVVGYNFEAGDASDVSVTDLTYNVIGDTDGALANAADIDVPDFVSACSLYDAETGSLVDGPEGVEDEDLVAGGESEIVFENFNWTIPAGETKKMKLRCNFANVDTDGGDPDLYTFFIDAAGDVTAEDDDGDDVDADLSAVDAEANDDGDVASILIVDAGALTVTLDGASPDSDIILGNSTGVAVSTFKFEADDENFLVKELALRNCIIAGADADDDCADGGEVAGDDVVAASVMLEYQNQAGTTVNKTGFLSGGMAQFSGLDFYVPSSATRTLKVKLTTNAVSATGADSGDMIQLNFDAEASGDAEFEAVGSGSGETLTEADVDTYVAADDMIAHKTRPTITKHASSPSGASIPGLNEVLRFNVSADSRGFVTLDQLLFNVVTGESGSAFNACDTLADDDVFQLYDVSNSSNKLDDDGGDWTFVDATDAACMSGGGDMDVLEYAWLNFEDVGADPEEIGAGTTKTYVLKIDTTGASTTDDDSIRVDIVDQDEADGVFGGLAAIQWDDDVEGDDFDGIFVKDLPVEGGTMVY
ncbi:hypothetical protein HYV73_01345 [Candidatus Uhrbacteria bacterium]|nr:hypothetical protein [Candidatus Uhrbacteria bacterium]